MYTVITEILIPYLFHIYDLFHIQIILLVKSDNSKISIHWQKPGRQYTSFFFRIAKMHHKSNSYFTGKVLTENLNKFELDIKLDILFKKRSILL